MDRSPDPFDLVPPRIRTLVWIVILSVIGGVLFVFEGLAFHLTPWSQVIVNVIVFLGYPTRFQGDTTVLLFTEADLTKMNVSVPVPYKIHARVLDRLSDYQPRAVLVDFAFIKKPLQQDKDQDKLTAAICKLAHTSTANGKPTRVYLALTTLPPLEPLLRCDEQPHPTPVSVTRDSEYGVSGVLSYKPHGDAYERGSLESPAFAMLESPLPKESKRSMELIWDPKPAQLNLDLHLEGCGPPEIPPAPLRERLLTGDFSLVRERLSQLVRTIHLDPLLATQQPCPHTGTVLVDQFLDSDPKDPNHPIVQGALHGKTVFYGAAFLMAGDTVISPVSGEVAAVYLHAMAYDNLLTFGPDDYKLEKQGLANIMIDALLLLFVVAALLFADKPFKRLPRSHPSVRWGVLGLAALVAVLWWICWPSVMFVPHSWSMKVQSAVVLLLPLFLVGTFAVLGPASAAPESPQRARKFLRRCVLTVISGAAAIAVILVVGIGAGFPLAALTALLCYFLYKLFVANDTLLVVTALLFVAVSALGFWFARLGPRNIIAYLLFFEVARHLIRRADEVATEYFGMRSHHDAKVWGWSKGSLQKWDLLFSLFLRNSKEKKHARMAGRSA
jgi:CHASE2 domain-containing sensor protein